MIGILAATSLAVFGATDSLPCAVRGSQQWLSTRASPLDSVEVEIQAVRAKICYSRPSARGRSVYDSLAPFGKVWRTGANEPTTLLLSDSLVVGDVMLPAGRFVILSVPDSARWLVLLHSAEGTDPARMFQSLRAVARTYAPASVSSTHVEQFTISASSNDSDAAFVLAWGVIAARLRLSAVKRQPNEKVRLTALASVAAGSLRSPAALPMVRRSLTPTR